MSDGESHVPHITGEDPTASQAGTGQENLPVPIADLPGQGFALVSPEVSSALVATESGREATVGMFKELFFIDWKNPNHRDPVTGKRSVDLFVEGCNGLGIALDDPAVVKNLQIAGGEILTGAPGWRYGDHFRYAREIFALSGESPEDTAQRFTQEADSRLLQARTVIEEHINDKSSSLLNLGWPHTALTMYDAVDQLPPAGDVLAIAEGAFELITENERLTDALGTIPVPFSSYLYKHADQYAAEGTLTAEEIKSRSATIIRHFAMRRADKFKAEGYKYDRERAEELLAIIEEELSDEDYPKPEQNLEKILQTVEDPFSVARSFDLMFETVQTDAEKTLGGDATNNEGQSTDLQVTYSLKEVVPTHLAPELARKFRASGRTILDLKPGSAEKQRPNNVPLDVGFAAFAIANMLEREQWPAEAPFIFAKYDDPKVDMGPGGNISMPNLTPESARMLVNDDRDLLKRAADQRLQEFDREGNDMRNQDDYLIRCGAEAALLYQAAGAIPDAEAVVPFMQRMYEVISHPRFSYNETIDRRAMEQRQRANDAIGQLANLWAVAESAKHLEPADLQRALRSAESRQPNEALIIEQVPPQPLQTAGGFVFASRKSYCLNW